MAQATRKENERSPLAIHLAQGLKEAALWIFLVAGLVLLLALSTYNAKDPGFSFSGEAGGHIQNAIGPAGAWLADFLYFLIGYPAYLLAALLIWSGWLIFAARRSTEPVNKWHLAARIGGLLLSLLTASGLASINSVKEPGGLPVDAGGEIGRAHV